MFFFFLVPAVIWREDESMRRPRAIREVGLGRLIVSHFLRQLAVTLKIELVLQVFGFKSE